MVICDHLAPNGEKSKLYQDLSQEFGDKKAHDYWEAIRTEQFLLGHKDWMDDIDDEFNQHLDENGEPTAQWVKDQLGIKSKELPISEKIYSETVSHSFEPKDGIVRGTNNRDSEEAMISKVKDLYTEALTNPNKLYNITYEPRSDKYKFTSGYTAKELANLFDTGDTPPNIRFTEGFKKLIDNSSRRILESLRSNLPVELMNRNEVEINNQAAQILIPKRDAEGKLEGYFSSAEQQDIVNSAMQVAHQFLLKDATLGSNAIVKTFKAFQAKAIQNPDSQFKYLHDQRVRIANELLSQMKDLNFTIDEKGKAKILRAVQALEYQKEIDTKDISEKQPEYDLNQIDSNTQEFVESLGHGLSDWGEVSFEHDPKDTASGRMKMFIGNLTDMDRGVFNPRNTENAIKLTEPSGNLEKYYTDNLRDLQKIAEQVNRKEFWMKDQKITDELKRLLDQNHSLLPKRNFLGLNKLVDFESTFQDILETLADSPIHDYETYTNTLRATGRPNLINLSNVLDQQDQQVKNEFSRLVSTQYTNFMMMLYNRTTDSEGNTEYKLTPSISNRYSQFNTIVKNWKENQKLSEIMKINDLGQRVIDVDRAKNKWIPAMDTFKKVDWSSTGDITKQTQVKKYVQDMLRISGIHMSDEMMDYLFDNRTRVTKEGKAIPSNMEKLTKGTSVAGGIGQQFAKTEQGEPAGMFTAFAMKMAGVTDSLDINNRTDNKEELESRAELHNPLYTENTTMQILSKVAARFTPTLHSGSSKNAEGKDIWNYTMHNKLSHLMIDMTDNFDAFNARYQDVDIAKDNVLLKTILNKPAYRDKIKLMYMDGIKPAWGNRGTMRPDMSDREQLLMSVALFQNQGGGFDKIPRVHMLSLTHSDKTTTPLFMNMPRLDTGKETIPREIVGRLGSVFFNIFKGEYDRIIKQKDTNFNDSRYDKGKGLFYFMPEFNHESMKKMVDDGFITDKEFKTIWTNGEKNLTQFITKDRELPIINKILNKVIEDRIQTTKDAWTKNGLITEEANLFDKKYVKEALKVMGIDRQQTNEDKMLNRIGSIIRKNGRDLSKKEVNDIAVEYAAKDYALNYFIHNVSLSQLFYGDPAMTFKGGKSDMESVDLTMKEYGKRLAKDIAPGLDPYFRPQDKKYNAITLADHIQQEKYLENLSNIFPSYKKVNATDAQEFTTVAEHLIVKYANGEISSKIFNEMMNIVKPGKYYEFTNPDHLAIIMQPLKPVYAGQRDAANGAMLEDYIKTSSIPLYPPATAGLEIEGLRNVLESKNISRAAFESGKKEGSPTKPAQFFNQDGTFKMPEDAEINGAIQQLDRQHFRIQQEVPYDEDKEAIKTVSQMNKLIVEGIDDIQGFKIGDKDFSGSQIRDMKEQVRKDMVNMQFDQFLKDWNIDQYGKLMDKSIVYDKLAALATTKNFTMNELQGLLGRDEKGNLWIPLQYNSGADRYESMLMSMIKDISQIKMPGKSFVQASSVGLRFKEGKLPTNGKVVYVGDYNGEPLKTTRIEDGVVKPAQVLLPFNFTDSDGHIRNAKEFVGEDGKIDPKKVPPELLQLIGARIPNQGHSSMAAMEIVGFLPKEMGDTVFVPAGFTKQMGADFDVDKLYAYRRPYSHSIADDSFLVKTPPDSMSKLQNDYFDVHHSVLTHPEMAEKILKPLDKPDLKEENELLAPSKAEGSNFYDHINQLQDFQNGKDAKMLVALTSLAVTFNSVIQNKNLHYAIDVPQISENGKVYNEQQAASIRIKDEHSDKILELTNLSGNGKSYYTKKDGGDRTPESIRSKSDNHSTIQSAAVDNAKDRSLDNLNITPHTYSAIRAFMDLETKDGEAANLKYGTRLLTQPIIKEFATEMKKGNDSLSETFDRNLKENVIEKLREKYKVEGDQEEIIFDPQLLKKAQTMNLESDGYKRHQLAALSLFEQLDAIGKRESELQSYFNQDTQGAGPNLLTAFDKADKLTNLDLSPIANGSQIFNYNDKITEAGRTAQVTTLAATKFISQILPYDKYLPLFNELNTHAGKLRMSIDDQREVLKAVRSFTYNTGDHWWADASKERGRLLYNSGESTSLSQRVDAAKRTWGKDNYFLQRLDSVIGDTTFSPDYIEYQAVTTGRIDESNNNRAWLDMLMSKNLEQRKLGEDLLRYTYLTGGVQDANSFVKFVPNSYISNTDFGNMLKEKAVAYEGESSDLNNPTLDMPGFVQQYLQHNPKKAFQISRDLFGEIPSEQNYPESFKIDSLNPKENQKVLLKEDGVPREFISYRSSTENKWVLYHVNYMPSGDVYYTRIDTLGNQYTDEYDGENSGIARSIFTENRSLAEYLPAPSAQAQYAKEAQETLGDYYKGTTHYEELNIHEGFGAYNHTFDTIANDKKIPENLRSVARYFRNSSITDAEFEAKKLLGIDYKPRIEFDSKMVYNGLAYMDGKITLNPKTESKQAAASTFLHEQVHQRLMSTIALSGYDSRAEAKISDTNKQHFQDLKDKFAYDHPEIIKHVRELDRIRFEAFEKLKSEMGTDAIIEAERKIAVPGKDDKLNSREGLYYALSTLQEFGTHVMTDKATQDYLNNISHREGTFLKRVWSKITDLIKGISLTLNKWVKKDSLLRQAIYHTVSLTGGAESSGNITDGLVKGDPIRVPTESEAKDLKELAETAYNRDVTISSDELGHTVSYGALRKATSLSGRLSNLADQLKKQRDKAYLDISKGTEEDRIHAHVRYNDLRQDYNDFMREHNNSMIQQIARKQLDWADKVLNNPNVNAATTQAAIDTASMWDNLRDTLYGKSKDIPIDPTLDKIREDAGDMRTKLLNNNALKIVTDAFKDRITLTPSDFDADLKEVNAAESKFLTLSRVKPKLMSGIGMLNKEGTDNRDEHASRVHNQLLDLSKRMKKLNITANDFMQKDSWGLKDRISNTWHLHMSELNERRDTDLDAAYRQEGLSDEQRKERQQQAWQDYWNSIKKVGAFVDTRVFFDANTGAKTSGDKYDKAFNDLSTKVGSEDYANELVDRAHEKYQSYLKERTIMADHLNSTIHLSDDEKIGKSSDEQDVERTKKVHEALDKWLQTDSPHQFLDKMTQKGKVKYVNNGSRFVVMAPRADQSGFYDKDFGRINSDPKVKAVFDEYKSIIQQMTSYLPFEHSEKLPPGFFPIISRETIVSLSSMMGKLRNFDATLLNAFTATEGQEYARLKPDEIPIMFTSPTKWTENEGDRSTDLIKVAQAFSMMALHYKYMAPILDQVNVVESIIKEANRQRVQGNDEGPMLRNALDMIKYNKDKLIFNKPNELEGKVPYNIYSFNLIKQAKAQSDIKHLTEEKTRLQQEILKKEDEGDFDIEKEGKEIESIDKKLDQYDKDAKFIYGSKIADTLISINQLKALSYNPFSAVANFAFALISNHIYATGRTDFDPSHLLQAQGIMNHAALNYFTFGAGMDGTAIKIRNLMERSQVMTEIANSEHAATHDRSRVKEALSPFNWQKSGDYMEKGKTMVAMMLKKTVEVTDAKTGEKSTIRLWDAMNNEGKWDTDKYMDNPNWYSEDVSQQKEWNQFRDKMRAVATIIYGNQDKNSPLLAKKSALWRLAGQFRMSWFPEGLNTRFGSERFDPMLGRDVKGRYRSVGTIGVASSAMIMARSLLDMLPGIYVDRFKGLTNKDGSEIKDIDKENMRRNFAGLAWTMAFTASILMIRSLYDDKHKGKKKDFDSMTRQLLVNQLIRNQQDLMMYASPGVWDTVTGNIVPATSVINDGIKAIYATGHYLFGDTHKDKHAFQTWMLHLTKATPILNNINKTKYMTTRDLDSIK